MPGFRILVKLDPWLFALFLATVIAPAAFGQASMSTASRALRFQGFGTYSYTRPDYDTGTNYGVTLGTDLDFNTPTWVKPGLELRATRNSGDSTNQYTYGGGPRIVLPISHVQPYVDFLISGGKIEFNHLDPAAPDYQANRSTVYSYGGGADVLLTRSWAVRLDAQSQRWKLSHSSPPFHPLLVSVGLRYQIGGGAHGPQ
jgi:hypothetical protein